MSDLTGRKIKLGTTCPQSFPGLSHGAPQLCYSPPAQLRLWTRQAVTNDARVPEARAPARRTGLNNGWVSGQILVYAGGNTKLDMVAVSGTPCDGIIRPIIFIELSLTRLEDSPALISGSIRIVH
jgi:hypothetical protein